MNMRERHSRRPRQTPERTTWGGIFGQCACCLTEPAALIDRQRLKRHFSAYWRFSSSGSNWLFNRSPFRRKKSARSESQNGNIHSSQNSPRPGLEMRLRVATEGVLAMSLIPRARRARTESLCAAHALVIGLTRRHSPARRLYWTINFPAIGGCRRQAYVKVPRSDGRTVTDTV